MSRFKTSSTANQPITDRCAVHHESTCVRMCVPPTRARYDHQHTSRWYRHVLRLEVRRVSGRCAQFCSNLAKEHSCCMLPESRGLHFRWTDTSRPASVHSAPQGSSRTTPTSRAAPPASCVLLHGSSWPHSLLVARRPQFCRCHCQGAGARNALNCSVPAKLFLTSCCAFCTGIPALHPHNPELVRLP